MGKIQTNMFVVVFLFYF